MKNLFPVLFLLLLMGACKPTEKGYQAAYDAAREKRQAALADIDVNIPAGAIQQVGGPQLKEVEGSQVYVQNLRLKAEGEPKPSGKYCVAVAQYKMPTNARAQATDLSNEGYTAFVAKDTEGMYYTIAGAFPSLSEAVSFYNSYRQKPSRVYVGLPSAPVIIHTPTL